MWCEQDLKEEISRAQIQMMEPILRGPPGIEYLQKAFSKRYGPPSEARSSLPLTSQWISSFTEDCASVWEQHTSLISPRTAQSQVRPLSLTHMSFSQTLAFLSPSLPFSRLSVLLSIFPFVCLHCLALHLSFSISS